MAIRKKDKFRKILKFAIEKKHGFEMIEYFKHALILLKESESPPDDIDYALKFLNDLKYKTDNLLAPKRVMDIIG